MHLPPCSPATPILLGINLVMQNTLAAITRLASAHSVKIRQGERGATKRGRRVAWAPECHE